LTTKNKLLKKFLENPGGLKFRQIERLLKWLGFWLAGVRGSHRKYRHGRLKRDLTVPVHNRECKIGYKRKVARIIKNKIL